LRAAKTRQIAVIGTKPMGHGIVQVFSKCGYLVTMHDTSAAVLQAAEERMGSNLRFLSKGQPDDEASIEETMARINTTTELFNLFGQGCNAGRQHVHAQDHGHREGGSRQRKTRDRSLVQPALSRSCRGSSQRGTHVVGGRGKNRCHAQGMGRVPVQVQKGVPGPLVPGLEIYDADMIHNVGFLNILIH